MVLLQRKDIDQFHQRKHTKHWDNQHQPYPTLASIKTHSANPNYRSEEFRKPFAQDNSGTW